MQILGDGRQSKSYIHVEDVVDAVLLAASQAPRATTSAFNVATGDYITVTEIADLAVEAVGLDPAEVRYEYTGGDRGWRATSPSSASTPTGFARSAGATARSSREALQDVDAGSARGSAGRPRLT